MAPDVGFEPTTKRLTAAYSTAELIWINKDQLYNDFNKLVKALGQYSSFLAKFPDFSGHGAGGDLIKLA